MTDVNCPVCGRRLERNPAQPIKYRPPFVPHRDWCENHGVQLASAPEPEWQVAREALRKELTKY